MTKADPMDAQKKPLTRAERRLLNHAAAHDLSGYAEIHPEPTESQDQTLTKLFELDYLAGSYWGEQFWLTDKGRLAQRTGQHQ